MVVVGVLVGVLELALDEVPEARHRTGFVVVTAMILAVSVQS